MDSCAGFGVVENVAAVDGGLETALSESVVGKAQSDCKISAGKAPGQHSQILIHPSQGCEDALVAMLLH